MDNRDRNIRCPFYRPGRNDIATQRQKNRRMRTIHCQGETVRISVEYTAIEQRIAFANRYCKCDVTHCPVYKSMEDMET